ncbi:DGC domain protein [Haloterrigena turkmenica DSM 5511]|uniref:DGC domain protein n=1 Tax=Haloterrigena turkmenica (strain ATCC 51198 / DSM 5511 / JCM 9101 / NCIMB 13204 / VKM B-1734 / 4k) TaxID=543526 RepID=D2RVX6_HALTV|nr:putative zinc-binding protein [Haloterrigena turkmenica]ADB61405.1 DGC domain protein [Haloterrigena turkmenica DSM 5511]
MSDETEYDDLPLVYSCSGCSSAAQLANELAVSLDRDGVAEMSCIAGVGGGVAPLVDTATSGRPIVAIDGCPLECTKQCLDRHDVTPDRHYMLAEHGVAKEYHTDYNDEDAERLRQMLVEEIGDLQLETEGAT